VAADLVDTMDSFGHCLGLAATQLGEMVRMIAVDVTGHKKATASNGRLVLVNPRIASASGAEVGREGCLSIPELTANVRRATEVVVESADGVVRSEGFEAICLQHEIDHLDGLLAVDRPHGLDPFCLREEWHRLHGPDGRYGPPEDRTTSYATPLTGLL
jgi:peptide deformylase